VYQIATGSDKGGDPLPTGRRGIPQARTPPSRSAIKQKKSQQGERGNEDQHLSQKEARGGRREPHIRGKMRSVKKKGGRGVVSSRREGGSGFGHSHMKEKKLPAHVRREVSPTKPIEKKNSFWRVCPERAKDFEPLPQTLAENDSIITKEKEKQKDSGS